MQSSIIPRNATRCRVRSILSQRRTGVHEKGRRAHARRPRWVACRASVARVVPAPLVLGVVLQILGEIAHLPLGLAKVLLDLALELLLRTAHDAPGHFLNLARRLLDSPLHLILVHGDRAPRYASASGRLAILRIG